MIQHRSRLPRPRRRQEGGFTLIEIMIALLILLIGIAGILTLQITSMRATSYSRHATEASVVGEDLLEQLRTIPAPDLTSGSDVVDSRGITNADGPFTRTWTVTQNGGMASVTVRVSWLERGADDHGVIFSTQRRLQ